MLGQPVRRILLALDQAGHQRHVGESRLLLLAISGSRRQAKDQNQFGHAMFSFDAPTGRIDQDLRQPLSGPNVGDATPFPRELRRVPLLADWPRDDPGLYWPEGFKFR
jgi:hypothetical protein